MIFTLEMPLKTLLFYSCFSVATMIIDNIFSAICETAYPFFTSEHHSQFISIKRKSTDHKKTYRVFLYLLGFASSILL